MASIQFFSIFFLVVIIGYSGVSAAAIYEVGDGGGWNNNSVIDYNNWAESKRFYVGDSIVFNYNSSIHNVRKVSGEEYSDCLSVSPIATYTNGNDRIILDSVGTHYFMCSSPGMCKSGQRVKIHVLLTQVMNNPTPPALAPDMPSVGDSEPISSSSPMVIWNSGVVFLVIFAVAFSVLAIISGIVFFCVRFCCS